MNIKNEVIKILKKENFIAPNAIIKDSDIIKKRLFLEYIDKIFLLTELENALNVELYELTDNNDEDYKTFNHIVEVCTFKDLYDWLNHKVQENEKNNK